MHLVKFTLIPKDIAHGALTLVEIHQCVITNYFIRKRGQLDLFF